MVEMEPRTLNEPGSTSPANRLTDFASHILEGHTHDHDHDHEHEQGALSFTGAGGILESSDTAHAGFDVEDAVREAMERHHAEHGGGAGGGYEAHIDPRIHAEEEEGVKNDMEGATYQHPDTDPQPGPSEAGATGTGSRGMKGRKRKAGEASAGEVAQSKRDSHKEVERKRRTNINDGIDQLVATMNLPEFAKAGKGAQLKKAVEYMAELMERVGTADKDVEDLRKEKQDLEANLALTSQRYTEEHERCTSYERMWREAQDRGAKSQFEIAQLLDEMAQLRRRLGEGE